MILAFCVVLAAASPAPHERIVAVLPVEAGAFDAGAASALETEVRAAVVEVLGQGGLVSAEAQRALLAGSRLAPAEAARKLSATHVLSATTRRMEGALAVSWSLVSSEGKSVGTARLVGFTPAEIRAEARRKIEDLLREAFGMAAPRTAAVAGTLRLPAVAHAQPAPAPAETVPPAAPAAVETRANPPAGPVAAPQPQPSLEALIRETISDVETVRGLKRQTQLQVLLLDDEAFAKTLRKKVEQEMTPPAIARERARWTAFNLAPPSADPRKVILSVLDEQVAGFYDRQTKALTVRAHVPASAAALGSEGIRFVLAHEIEHALQDQHFGIPDLASETDDDARLARLSLFEGDAQATMIAVAAHRVGKPVKLALSASSEAMKDMTADEFLRKSGFSPELLHAPAVVREELLTPYVAGLQLVAEVHRRGGWALVNRMFQSAPSTMHEVLHPEAYLAGERPAPVPFPPAPPGLETVASGRMGEVGARLALSGCVEDKVARDLVSAWGGDAYTIVRTSAGKLALIWSTSWSDGATSFANLLKMQTPCWQDAARLPEQQISADAEIRLDGPRVGLARGLSRFALETAAASAATFAGLAPAPLPPLGKVKPPAGAEKGRIEEGRFLDPRLRLGADLPEGFDADVKQPQQEIVLRKERPTAVATVTFVPEAAEPATVNGFFEATATALATQLGGMAVQLKGAQQTTLLGGTAQERSWEVPGTRMLVRVTLAPACGGKAFYAVMRAAADEAPRKELEKFVSSLHFLGDGPSPACEELE